MCKPVAEHACSFFVLYHQFAIHDCDEVPGQDLDLRTNGLVSIDDGEMHIHTRVDGGEVHVAAQVYLQAPPAATDEWDDVVEASLSAPDGDLQFDGVTCGAPEGFPVLSAAGPGDYRVRVHARGRDTTPWTHPDTITEFYLVQVWPAPLDQPRVWKATDQWGAQRRQEVS